MACILSINVITLVWMRYILITYVPIFLLVTVPDGKPIIGPAPGIPKALFATGHEGSGLCMV